MKILFIDKNKSLVDKVSKLWLETYCDDIFNYKWVIVTASNPKFTMWWWLDRAIYNRYSDVCKIKQSKLWLNERIEDIIFTITVNNNIQAEEYLVKEAIEYAIDNIKPNETLLLSWLGTWIWWLSEEKFVKILHSVIISKWNDQYM